MGKTIRHGNAVSGHWYTYSSHQPVVPPGAPPVVASPRPSPRALRRQSARDRVRQRKIRRQTGAPDDWAWVIIATALLGITAVMSIALFFGGRFLQSIDSGNSAISTSVPIEPTSVLYGPGGVIQTTGDAPVGGMLEGESMIIRRWEGNEPFTILVMGMDKRPGDLGVSFRTDTMILVRLDPTTKRVSMLSIPRDLYVDIPGYGPQKINSAYALGELEGPGGGPLLAMRTVQYNLGIRVNEYAVINFDAFIGIIDLIGGIKINVPYPINDPLYPDMNYGYDPFYVSAGWQDMDGTTALKYARSRHSSDDIDRARRQQSVIYAVRDKVLAYDMIPELVVKAPALWAELRSGIDTGLSLEQIIELAWYMQDIPTSSFSNDVLGWDYVYARNWQGQDILVPNRDKIAELMVSVFGPGYNQ